MTRLSPCLFTVILFSVGKQSCPCTRYRSEHRPLQAHPDCISRDKPATGHKAAISRLLNSLTHQSGVAAARLFTSMPGNCLGRCQQPRPTSCSLAVDPAEFHSLEGLSTTVPFTEINAVWTQNQPSRREKDEATPLLSHSEPSFLTGQQNLGSERWQQAGAPLSCPLMV